MQYRAREGESLDAICYRHYGRESALVAVLDANAGLANVAQSIPAGTLIELPDLPSAESVSVSLWN